MARRAAFLIGNGEFTAEPGLGSLAGPKNDVERLAQVLEDREVGGFDVQRFVDSDSGTLQHTLESTLTTALRDDLILIYYSGHGKLDAKGQLCLTTSNTRLDVLRSTSLTLPFLRSIIEDSPSQQIILVLDCCYSGAAAKAFVRSSVEDQLAVAQNAGLHILTSSTSVETSRERENEQGGLVLGNFTRCLVDGISSGEADVNDDSLITLADLRDHLQRRLRGQRAQYYGFEVTGDIVVARNRRVRETKLPDELLQAIASPFPAVREGAARALGEFLPRPHMGLRLAAKAALEKLAEDDSRQVCATAKQFLKSIEASSDQPAAIAETINASSLDTGQTRKPPSPKTPAKAQESASVVLPQKLDAAAASAQSATPREDLGVQGDRTFGLGSSYSSKIPKTSGRKLWLGLGATLAIIAFFTFLDHQWPPREQPPSTPSRDASAPRDGPDRVEPASRLPSADVKRAPAIASFRMFPNRADLVVGEKIKVRAEPRDERGDQIYVEVPTTLEVAHPSIASVSSDGVLTAWDRGETILHAIGEGIRSSMPVRVAGRPLQDKGYEPDPAWMRGSLYGHDNDVARFTKITISEKQGLYQINIPNQFGFSCELIFQANGKPWQLRSCATQEGGWEAIEPRITLRCDFYREDEVCRGPYTLCSGTYCNDAQMVIARRPD